MSSMVDPSPSLRAVTPHDTNALRAPRALYVGVSGDIVLQGKDDSTTVTLKAVPVGILPVRPVLVKATGTTATDLVALY